MTVTEKAAYVKGLAEGLALDEGKPEGKIIKALIDLVEDLALTVSDLEEKVDTLEAYAEELDEDLGDVEAFVFDDGDDYDDDDDYDFDDDDDDEDDFDCIDCEDCDGDCENCEGDCDEMFAVECPECGDAVYFDNSIDVENLTCPNCGKKIDIDHE